MFNSYTIGQAKESLGACKTLLKQIYDKGNIPFDAEDSNVLDQSISTLYILMNDTDLELRTTPVFAALEKAQTKLHTQKIHNTVGFYESPDHKADLLESLTYIDETINLLESK